MTTTTTMKAELQRLLLEGMTHELGNLTTTVAFLAANGTTWPPVQRAQATLSRIAADLTRLLRSQRAVVYGDLLGWAPIDAQQRTAADWCETFGSCLTALTNPGTSLRFTSDSMTLPAKLDATLLHVAGACICQMERMRGVGRTHRLSVRLSTAAESGGCVAFRFSARSRDSSDLIPVDTNGPWVDLAIALCRSASASPALSMQHGEFTFHVSFRTD